MSHENVSPITGQGPGSTDHPLSLERTLDRALQWIEDGDLEDAKAAIQGVRRKLDGDEDRALIAEFAALIQEINPTINRIVEGVDTERASDGDTITDVLLSCCGLLGGGQPSLYINPPAETFAHCVGGIEDELRQARETGLNLVLLSSDGEVNQTWLVTDDTAAILQPLAAPQGSPAPEGSTAVSH